MSVQDTISDLAEQERTLQREVEEAQAQQEAEDRRQQQLQEQRAKALEEEDRITAELARTQASIAQLQTQMEQVPVLSDVSHSEEEDPDISSSDGSDAESDSDHAEAALQNGHATRPPRVTPSGVVAGSRGKQLSLTQMLQELCSDNKQAARLGLASRSMHDHLENLAKKVRVHMGSITSFPESALPLLSFCSITCPTESKEERKTTPQGIVSGLL